MKSYKLSDLTQTEVDSLKARPRINFSSIFSTVSCFILLFGKEYFIKFKGAFGCVFWKLFLSQVEPIVDDVRNRGDDAVKELVLFILIYTPILINEEKSSYRWNHQYSLVCTLNDTLHLLLQVYFTLWQSGTRKYYRKCEWTSRSRGTCCIDASKHTAFIVAIS